MGRAETAALLASGFLLFTFVRYRLRMLRRRREGPSLELLGRFDYRVVLSELEPLIEAAAEERARGPAAHAAAVAAPAFLKRSPWATRPEGAAGAIFDVLEAGGEPEAVLPVAASLSAHFAVLRLLEGDLDGAERLAERIAAPQGRLLSAAVSLARAERLRSARDEAGARREAERASSKARALERALPSSMGREYLLLHLQLGWRTHALNVEWSVASSLHRIRGLVRRFGEAPHLHLASAWAHALLGAHDEALDELGRALYFSRGDPFYARAILESPFVARSRPALLAQCRGAEQVPVG